MYLEHFWALMFLKGKKFALVLMLAFSFGRFEKLCQNQKIVIDGLQTRLQLFVFRAINCIFRL